MPTLIGAVLSCAFAGIEKAATAAAANIALRNMGLFLSRAIFGGNRMSGGTRSHRLAGFLFFKGDSHGRIR